MATRKNQEISAKVVINSHASSGVARSTLEHNLLEHRVNQLCEIIFVIGGESSHYERRGHGQKRNIRWIGVEYNAIDFNGLIWASEKLGEKDWFLYVHDTVKFGKDISVILRSLKKATKSMLAHVSMSIGTYLVRDLQKDEIRGKLKEYIRKAEIPPKN